MNERFRRKSRPFSSRRWSLALQSSRNPGRSLEQRRLLSIEPLEDRRLLTIDYVANPAAFTDTSAPGNQGNPQAGDTVTWNGGGQFTSAVAGLTYGTNAFGTIQDAVNAASSGDTIDVAPGTYSEKVTVNVSSLTIDGAQFGVDGASASRGTNEAVLDASGDGGVTPFYVTASDVTLDGFTVENETSPTQFGFGILLGVGTSGPHVLDNVVQDNVAGIGLANSSPTDQTVIQGNLIKNNNQPGVGSGNGIYLDQFSAGGPVTNVLIDSNSFVDNGNVTNTAGAIGFSSTSGAAQTSNVTISNNLFDGNYNGLYAYETVNSVIADNTFKNSGQAGIGFFGDDSGVTITNNTITNSNTDNISPYGAGIEIGSYNDTTSNSNITINDNTIANQANGAHNLQLDPFPNATFGTKADAYTGTLDATNNYWGTTDSAAIQATIGDPNSQVNFTPFLGQAPTLSETLQIVGGQTQVVDANGNVLFQQPATSTTPIDFTNNSGQAMTLTIDYSNGDPAPGGFNFTGGGSDSLVITGYPTTSTLTETFTGPHSGSVQVDSDGVITYSGLLPVTNSGAATNIVFNLPAGTVDATFADVAGSGQLSSGNGAFETTTFTDPTGSLTVNAGSGADTMTVAANFTTDFAATLNLNGASGNADTFNLLSSPAGKTTTIDGMGDTATVVIGNTAANVGTGGSLAAIAGPVTVQNTGAGGTTSLTVDDSGDTVGQTVAITPTQVSGYTGVGTISYDANTTSLSVDGGSGSDTFNVTPSAATAMTINGGLPNPPATPGDTLNVDLTGTTGASLSDTFDPLTGYFGAWTFTNAMPVNFSDIETLANVTDLTITKSDDHGGDSTTATTGSAVPGTSLTYTIVVSNAGPDPVTGVAVDDSFPGDFTAGSYTATQTGGASGFTASGSGDIHDTVDMPVGSTITYVVTGTIGSAATGTLSNTATVTPPAGVFDNNTANNTATDDDTLTPTVDLTISKTDNSPFHPDVPQGTAFQYTITVANTGPSDAPGAGVTDTFPLNFTGATYTASATGGATGFTAVGAGNINDTVNLPAGSSITYIVSGAADLVTTGPLDNTATITAPAGVTNTNPSNTATDNLTETTPVGLLITKADDHGGSSITATNGSVTPGTALTYTITVSNIGGIDVTGATVADAFPAGFTGASYTAAAAGGASDANSTGSGDISDTVNLPVGSSITYTVTGTVASSATGSLSNTATVTPPAGFTDTAPANDTATDTDTLTPQANITITKTDDKGGDSATSTTGSVAAGTAMTYTIVVSNTGPSDVTGAAVADAFPAGFTGASYTATATGTATGFTASGSGNISDTVNLPAGSSITYVVTGTVASSATGTLSNTANVTPTSGPAVSATDIDTITTQATLSVSKSDNKGGDSATSTTGSVAAGTAMTYTIVISNAGPSDVSGVTVTDPFPASFTGAAYTATATGGATGFTASGNGDISDGVHLPAGSSITYVVTGTVASSATGTLSNSATATPPSGPAVSATDTDTITTQATIAVSKSDNKGGDSTTSTTGSVVAGTALTYTIVVSNTGPSDVTGAAVADTFPAGFTGAAYTATATGGATGFTASGSGNISNTVTLPAGSSITYVVAGTVASSATGTLSNTATVTPTSGPAVSATDTDTVTPAPVAPAITSANSADFAEGSSNTFTVTATGAPTPALTETGALPGGVTFVDNGDGTATLSGTPATGTAGIYTITITAHNGVSPDATQTFTLTVSAAIIQGTGFGYLAGVPGDGTIQTFVHNLYRELLGREPDATGDTFWTGYLAAHDNPIGRATVVSDFMNSPEYKAHYITTLYEVFLGRAPEASGLQFWTDKMGSPGTPGLHGGSADESYILSAIVGSDEFYARAGGTPEGFVNALYQDLLGRPGEAAGVAGWVDLVKAQPTDRDGIVRLFLTSPEAEHKLLDSFYPAPGGTASNPLPAPGTGVAAGAYDLAVVTGDGWENLYLEGPFDSSPEGNDAFFAELAGGTPWDDVQLDILGTSQYYNNPNRPVT